MKAPLLGLHALAGCFSVQKPTLFSNRGSVPCAMNNPNDDKLLSAHLVIDGVGVMEHHAQATAKLLACCPRQG